MKKILVDHKHYVVINIIIIIILFLVICGICLLFFNRATLKRSLKSFGSEYNNGIMRKITVYDYHGNEIRSWEGRFDVTQGETGILFDDQTGKRVIITNGIVINEEIK